MSPSISYSCDHGVDFINLMLFIPLGVFAFKKYTLFGKVVKSIGCVRSGDSLLNTRLELMSYISIFEKSDITIYKNHCRSWIGNNY